MEEISIKEAQNSGIGTVLARQIPSIGAYHVAIVVATEPLLLAEHDYDGQRIATLSEFLFGQKRIWRMTYAQEMASQGPNCFRSPPERAAKAMALLREARPYCAHTYNCEHFTRICMFRDARLWSSPQVVGLLKSSSDAEFWGRLVSVISPFRAY